MDNFDKLKKRLPFSFEDDKILQNVFVHGSFLKEREGRGLTSNERLEFLGDAILESVISHILFEKFPERSEGELTRFRSRLVNRQVLALLARELSLGDYLLLGKGEVVSGVAENDAILSNTFEALLAAIYLDGGGQTGEGYKRAFAFIKELFLELIEDGVGDIAHFDHKPALQELTQARFKVEPSYELIAEEGLPHQRVFTIEVRVMDKILGTGTAGKKKDAEQLAAKEALDKLAEEELSAPEN